MFYYANIIKEDDVYIVTFPEFDNVITYGDTIEEAKQNAAEALNGCIESDFERGFSLPKEIKHQGKDYHKISIYPHIEIAIKLRKLRGEKSQIEIADKLDISYQAYQKLENPRKCNPTVKTLEKLSKALGLDLEIVIN